MNSSNPYERISQELSIKAIQVQSVIQLLQEGATVPFIARYRKEQTGSLDEVQIRNIQSRYEYLEQVEKRRSSILKALAELGINRDNFEVTDLIDGATYNWSAHTFVRLDPTRLAGKVVHIAQVKL